MVKAKNVIMIVTDQERHPTCYETPEALRFLSSLPGRNKLRNHGVEFHKHYTATCACTPSRATLYTGQYPSLHGITQTYGGAKSAVDERLVWLQPGSLPTIGDYFRQAGYDTHYIGKWHLSHEDILNDQGMAIPSVDLSKNPVPLTKAIYEQENKLDRFGFDGWIGPEPHGPGRLNSGWNRDGDFVNQFIEFIEKREAENNDKPFFLAINIVNPHDIVLFPFWLTWGLPTTDGTVPEIPPAPTAQEDLRTKPSTQLQYKKQYNKLFFHSIYEEYYRQLYYYLQKVADNEIERMYDTLANSSFFKDTAVVLTADHGELLGAHGGLRQKWYNAYEESLHIPLIISHPSLAPSGPSSYTVPTSSVDILPTVLGLCGLDQEKLRIQLEKTHTEARDLVGKDLSQIVFASTKANQQHFIEQISKRSLVFQIEDHVTEGDTQIFPSVKFYPTLLRIHHFEFDAVQGPTSIQAMIANYPSEDGTIKSWKIVRYWDNPVYWSEPGHKHVYLYREGHFKRGKTITRTEPLPDEYELYNLTDDPIESKNLYHMEEHREIFSGLLIELEKQIQLQCLKPINRPHANVDVDRAHVSGGNVAPSYPPPPNPNREPDTIKTAVSRIFGFPTLPRRVSPFAKL